MPEKKVLLIMVRNGVIYSCPSEVPSKWRMVKGARLNRVGTITSKPFKWGTILTDGQHEVFFDPETNTATTLKPKAT